MHTWRAECAELQPETSHRVAAWVHRAGASAATHRPPPRRRSACSTASRSAWRSAASATRSSRRCATTWSSSNAPSRAAPRSPCTSRCLSRRHAAARARACNRAHAPAPLPAPVPPPPHPGPYLGCADRVRVSVPRRRLGRAAAPHVGRLCRAVRHARPRAARRLGEGTAHYACTHYGSTTYYGASLHSPWSTIRYDCTYCRRSRPSPSP